MLARIENVVFGCSNSRFGGCGSVLALGDTNLRCITGVMEAEAIEILKKFYDQENPLGALFFYVY